MVFVRDSRYRYVLSLAATTTKPKNSGQVYKAAPQLTVLPEKWYNSSTGSDRDFRQFKNADGVASLSDMALRSFIRNRQELDADTLEYVDWNPVGKRLWEVIMKNDLTSVSLWKHFASAYGQEHPWPNSLNEKPSYQTPTIPPELLPDLIPVLGSPRGLLLTSLTLRNVELTRAQWVSLSKLDNLAIFQVHSSPGFSDQVVRAWSDRAIQNGAFAHLRVLEVVDEDEFTNESLKFLSQFPSLQVCQLSGRTFTPKSLLEAERHGLKRLCEHGNEDINLSFNNDLEWYNWGRLCPQSASCKKAHDLFTTLQKTLSLPLLKARCSPRSVDWGRRPQPRFVAIIVPDTSKPIKRHLELAAESSRPAPSKRKPALRQSAKKDATHLYDQLKRDYERRT